MNEKECDEFKQNVIEGNMSKVGKHIQEMLDQIDDNNGVYEIPEYPTGGVSMAQVLNEEMLAAKFVRDERHNFELHGFDPQAQYVSVFFPGLGNLTVTYETRSSHPDAPHPVVSIDFDAANLDIIDRNGNDREIS